MKQRITFDVYFCLIFLTALHGSSAAKVLVIISINFILATRLKREYIPVATWVFNIGILFANEINRGFPYEHIANSISSSAVSPRRDGEKGLNANWGVYLDSFGGLVPRWEVLFNVTVLRLISFNLDYYWGIGRSGSSPLEVGSHLLLRTKARALILTRRNSSIPPISQKEIEWTFRRKVKIILFATTSLTRFILLYILLDQFLLSMITYRSSGIPLKASRGAGISYTASDFSLLWHSWKS